MTTIAKIKVMMRTKPGGQNHILYSGSRTAVVDVVTHVVDEGLPRSGKKAIVEEVIAGSSHRSVLPKNLIAPLPERITKGGVRRTAVPSHGAHRKEGWRRIAWRR